MRTVFLSYSRKDHFFAELLEIKLAEAGIKLWRDQGQLLAGKESHQEIELALSNCVAIIVALSEYSTESPYVTFEWAYALGKGKVIIPIKIAECDIHPRLKIIQHLNFTITGALPWRLLIERIREIETDTEPDPCSPDTGPSSPDTDPSPSQDKQDIPTGTARESDSVATSILAYLNQRGYQMASFDRLRKRIDETLTDERLREVIANNPKTFRPAILAGGKPGLAKITP